MTTPISPATLEKLVPAAADSVGAINACYRVLSKMDIPNSERNNVAVALLYASMDQARSASFLIAQDVEQSVFGALILLRSQLDQLMRAAFLQGRLVRTNWSRIWPTTSFLGSMEIVSDRDRSPASTKTSSAGSQLDESLRLWSTRGAH